VILLLPGFIAFSGITIDTTKVPDICTGEVGSGLLILSTLMVVKMVSLYASGHITLLKAVL